MPDVGPGDLRWTQGKVIRGLLNTFFDIRVIGTRHIPREGPGLIAVNHASYLDPPLVGATIGLEARRIAGFFGAVEYLNNPVTRYVFEQSEGIPVERGSGSLGPVNAAKERLAQGKLVGIFPEGTRSPDGRIHKGRKGLGLIALSTGVPVIPCALTGVYDAWPRSAKKPNLGQKIVVRFGEPIVPGQVADPTDEQALAFSRQVMDRIRALAAIDG